MTAPRTLLPYQARWVADEAGLAVIEKSRRVGISWAEAYRAVMHAGEARGDVWYQAYSLEMARGWIADAAEWAEALQVAADAVGDTLIGSGPDAIQAWRLRMASGRTITAMPSSPRAWRGKGRPGDVAIIDEAAWIDDLDAVLAAALATRVWGGSVRVISTHRGEGSPFAALVRDLREGRQPGSLHTVTLTDALAQGLYQRICAVTGVTWTPEAETVWESTLRAEYGRHAGEELDCIPSAGAGAWLPWDLIRAAEDAEAGDPARTAGGPVWIGIDVARRRDLWVAVAIESDGSLLWLRELRAERGISFAAQAAIVAELVARWRPVRIAVDQTGMGEAVVEQLQADHGRLRVEGWLMTGPRRLDAATALREAVEDRRLRIPSDEALRRDLHAVRAEPGPSGAPRLIADRDATDGHADRFWALALACACARTGTRRYAYDPVRPAPLPPSPDDDDYLSIANAIAPRVGARSLRGRPLW